ncbi:bifunctional purine synthesis protein purC/E-like isoform X1 [Hibiscus syriacus]|uniref:Bifunctional purine synthesis protein purC/E-like isoform X1 n=1 Tax=Hibiscus syriacus TaxID=106335 RepID=A0A6A3AU25_HIBSY|nr:far upstream element-binding protein 2-like isoform X2 [Hibiscus syriacus]KAE8706409.1 bifunctional purine synthesis protein purC/E-like isoform X1 [Hibiscus syriacus]
MAEEEAVAAVPDPVPFDHKRKLEDLEPQDPLVYMPRDNAVDPDAEDNNVAPSDSSDSKRRRLDEDNADDLANENGFQAEESDEPAKEEEEAPQQNEVNKQAKYGGSPLNDAEDTVKHDQVEGTTEGMDQQSTDNLEAADAELGKVESFEADNGQEPTKEDNEQPSDELPQQEVDDGSTITRKMEVPNAKVGVLIGKAGEPIRYLQYNSGAKIQIMRDADADRDAPTRPVEIIGTLSSINKAEKLINAVIAEADAGGSPSLVARGLGATQATGAVDQIEIRVPNEKVGLIIGRGGETIKGLQTRSGARIQLIPQHLPEGDGSKERTVRVTGDKKQIEIAREMIKDVMNQTVRPSSLSGGFNQQGYGPRGTGGPPPWGPRGHPSQTGSYDYQQWGPYPSQNSHYEPPYGGYPSHPMAPRSNFGPGWEQRPHNMQGPPQSGGYDYYSRPSPAPAMGPASSQSNYSYGQPRGPVDYAHPPPYSQAAPQHGYGHGYEEKYENHTPVQHPYGGHGSTQAGYAQTGPQPGYAPQQQYGKSPSYAMRSQVPQSYGPTNQRVEVPYQGPTAQSYGPNVPPQQQYPYASSGPTQQSYPPYGSAPPSDGYSQPTSVTGQAYPQQGTQPVGYSQPTVYAQASTAGYGQYPPSQGYSEQQQIPNNAGYGYQGAQDSGYASGAAATYGAPPTSGQSTYAQTTAAHPTYDQSVTQSGGYAAATAPASAPASGTAPAGYGKTVSPQPGYPQYDSTQMYAAPR